MTVKKNFFFRPGMIWNKKEFLIRKRKHFKCPFKCRPNFHLTHWSVALSADDNRKWIDVNESKWSLLIDTTSYIRTTPVISHQLLLICLQKKRKILLTKKRPLYENLRYQHTQSLLHFRMDQKLFFFLFKKKQKTN